MYRIRVRGVDGKWYTHYVTYAYRDAIVEYNRAPVPKMFIDGASDKKKGILHKQYTDNGFVYNPNKV